MFQPLIVIYRWGDFVYHYWGNTSIYRPLSYPFRSLGQWTVYYTSLQSFIITLPLQLWGVLMNFDWLVICQNIQLLIKIYRRVNVVYYHRGSASIYRPLSYPFRSLGQLWWVLINFDWLVECQTFQPLIVIHIWDVHQFIGHCLIPLYPWNMHGYHAILTK